jgi:hypothetical protein
VTSASERSKDAFGHDPLPDPPDAAPKAGQAFLTGKQAGSEIGWGRHMVHCWQADGI